MEFISVSVVPCVQTQKNIRAPECGLCFVFFLALLIEAYFYKAGITGRHGNSSQQGAIKFILITQQ